MYIQVKKFVLVWCLYLCYYFSFSCSSFSIAVVAISTSTPSPQDKTPVDLESSTRWHQPYALENSFLIQASDNSTTSPSPSSSSSSPSSSSSSASTSLSSVVTSSATTSSSSASASSSVSTSSSSPLSGYYPPGTVFVLCELANVDLTISGSVSALQSGLQNATAIWLYIPANNVTVSYISTTPSTAPKRVNVNVVFAFAAAFEAQEFLSIISDNLSDLYSVFVQQTGCTSITAQLALDYVGDTGQTSVAALPPGAIVAIVVGITCILISAMVLSAYRREHSRQKRSERRQIEIETEMTANTKKVDTMEDHDTNLKDGEANNIIASSTSQKLPSTKKLA